MVPEQIATAPMQASPAQDVQVVLKPVSHPELGDIAIDDDLFPIGRTEPPFASYPPAVVDALSRRHARIFSERGKVYIADLDSKNGTMVNGVAVREKPSLLRTGDQVCFGGELCYRIELGPRQARPAAAARVAGVTLTPERDDLGLEPVVITRFPFLVGKSDEAFARYREAYPHQVNYLSRRHAHLFLKGGKPFVEDLGSTNGTFVAGRRLDEHAVPLADGDLLAFGGHHFVYRVSLQKEEALDPTVTRLSPDSPAAGSADTDKTTFVAAADSFLDIFCVDHGPPPEDEADDDDTAPGAAGSDAGRRRGRVAAFLAELAGALSGGEASGLKRWWRWGAAALALLLFLAGGLYFRGASEREVHELMADGDYAEAAVAADRFLAVHPDHGEVRALGTEAALKAHVPPWIAQLKARNFAGAAASLAKLQPLAINNSDIQALLGELEWLGDLEQFFAGRGGAEAPIRIYADEDRIRLLLKPWDEDPLGHQRAFDRIASYVPEFRDFYAEVLSHLRKLQSDDSVYLAAIERLKATVNAGLERDQLEGLEAALKEYGDKYPRLAGLDKLREEVGRYREIRAEAQARRPARVAALLARGPFSMPPFRARIKALAASGQLPTDEALRQYEAVAKAWRSGNIQQALGGLEQMAKGPGADAAARELARRKALAQSFGELQQARGSPGYDERLLAFYGSLDPEEDVYFVRATEADLAAHRDKALGRAQEFMNRAQSLWAQYRENGALAEEQRAESAISKKFSSQARLLAEARGNAQQGARLYALLKTDPPAPARSVRDDIEAETELQRQSLQQLGAVLEPGLLKAKLALLGGQDSDQGKSP